MRSASIRSLWHPRVILALSAILLFLPSALRAQQSEEFDQYKLRLSGYWFYSNPTGSVEGRGETVPVDFKQDLEFSTYSTFDAKVDWKFTHKNHFYVAIIPFFTSKTATLTRTFTFQGQTFEAGATVNSKLHAFYVAPGYQYDILRRKRGHLGIAVQINLFNTTAKISAAGVVSGGATGASSVSASGSLLAPIPVGGPEYRLYLTNSPRVFIEGNGYGMYFFGYGNFYSTANVIGVTLNKHMSVNAGYQIASRLKITGTNNRLGLSLTQRGAIAGVEFSF